MLTMTTEAKQAMTNVIVSVSLDGGGVGLGSCGGWIEGNSRAANSSGAKSGWLSWLR